MAGNRRDLHISITGDDKGLGAAFEDATADAAVLNRELGKVDRTLTEEERSASRAANATRRLSLEEEKAALAARKMALEVKRAADAADKAQVRSAAAAKAAERGLLDKAKADKIAERADLAVERSSIKAAEAQLTQAMAAEKAANEERKAADASDRHQKSTVGMTGVLVSAGAAAAALAVPLTAAGVAAIGFAAVAAPSIAKVVMAQADLATNWDTLDHGQKVAASSVHSLVGEYKSLAKSYEPEALQVFNGAVSTARGLLPELGKTVNATKDSVAGFATSVENTLGREIPRLAGVVRGNANPALNELGTTFDQTATLATSLVQDLAPMGLQLLGAANGGLRLLNLLEQLNPHLVEVGATLLAVRAPANALGNLFTSGATRLGRYGKAAGEAEKATATLGKTIGSSPNIYIGAALAVGLLSYRWATAKSALDNRVSAIQAEANATKNSTDAHQRAITELGNESIGWTSYNKAVAAGTEGLKKHYKQTDEHGTLRIAKAIQAEQKAVTNITQGEASLAKQYGLTATEADALATAAGVDLSKGITGSGEAATAAQTKIRQYLAAVKAASDTSLIVSTSLDRAGNSGLLLQDRLAALDSAFGALAGPELQAFDSTTKTATAFDSLDAALKKSKGSMSLNTDAGRAARAAFVDLLGTVQENSKAQYQLESVTLGVAKAKANLAARAKENLPLLLAETHGSKAAANAALDWANSQGLGKTRAEALNAILGQGRKAFLASAAAAGISKGAADKLWQAFNRLPLVKDTKLKNNAAAAKAAVQAYQNKLDALHGRTISVHTVYTSSGSRTFGAGNKKLGDWRGGPIHRANGGAVGMAEGGPSGPVVGPGSGTSDDIPVWLSNGEYVIRQRQARKHRGLLDAINAGREGFATGGPVGYAAGGDVGLSSILSDWSSAVKPSTKAQLASAIKSRRTQINQLASAEDALARARKRGSSRDIAAAERRIAAERSDLAAATAKLTDVEARYKFTSQSPAKQLGSALSLDIKATAAFVKNLTTLTDKGYGALAQQLLAMGGPEAERIAADAVKLSASKLKALNTQVGQEKTQQETLANLPALLTARAAIKSSKGGAGSWVALLNATGLDAASLAEAVKLMAGDLSKTPAGQGLIADMHAHGFARGGPVSGPSGTDRVPAWLTAGEYVMTRQATAAHQPLLDALNSGIRIPVPARSAPSSAAGGSGVNVAQTYVIQSQDPHTVARESARELAWTLRG